MQLGVIHHPLQGMGFLTWADALQPLVPALVLVGLLIAQREEISRARRATDRATEVLSGRAEIASTLAHDLRSPIATVKTLAATTTQNYDRLSDAERTEFLGHIEHEAGRLLDTINQASLALKVDAGTLVDDRRRLDLATLAREAIEAADTSGHYLTAELAPGFTVMGDRKNLVEALRQVIENAAKFSPSDAPIRVSSDAAGPTAVVEVADGGPGIPGNRRVEVVGRFARWRPHGYEDRPGSGLGLFISCGILAEHGGEIEIGEAPAGGTIVRIRLPLEVDP
jgi:signal transduction histidine kinase